MAHTIITKTKRRLVLAQMKQAKLKAQQKYLHKVVHPTPNGDDVLDFWRKGHGEKEYFLFFSYGSKIGNIIMKGLSPNYSWLVKDGSGKVVLKKKMSINY